MEVLSFAKAVDALASPFALERFSHLTGASLLAIDLDGAAARGIDAAAHGRALARLVQLPCPTVAVGGQGETGSVASLRDRCDVAVATPGDVEPIDAAARRNPLASMAAAQLLRLGEGRSLHDGLIAESLVYSMLQSGPEFARWLARRGAARPEEPADGPIVRVERCEDRLELTLDKPMKRNAFSSAMRDALVAGLQVGAADPSLRIVLRGNGPAFCAGGDLDEFGSLPDPASAHAIRSTRNAGRLLAECADRCEAQLHGACVGAGIELPAFASRVVAAPDTFFQLPEVAMGLVPGAGGTASIPRRVGRQRAAWLAISGERIDVDTALAWGLVDEVRPRDSAATTAVGAGS